MRHQTIDDSYPQTIAWAGDGIVDWSQAGEFYGLDGQRRQLGTYSIRFNFDRAITSTDGQYVFLYQLLGTKGVLLKNGEMLREINRSFYHANIYEYPAAFVTIDDVTYLLHCPVEYCQLDFENVETGELVTNIPTRQPGDMFHSRLEISPYGGYFMSKGWFWHPWDLIRIFDIRACLQNPLLLDGYSLMPDTGAEVSTAAFVTEQEVLLVASGEESMRDDEADVLPPGHMVVWNFQANTFAKPLPTGLNVGNVFPIDEKRAWDLYRYPKIISLETGQVLDKLETLETGLQSSSIIHHLPAVPAIILNRQTKQIAVKADSGIEVLSVE